VPARPAYAVEELNLALCRLVGRPRRVLDVGCGLGQNGAFCRGRGAHVVGLERDPKARAVAAVRLHDAVDADLESPASVASALGGQRFDLILFGDVLEHVRDPRAVLESVCEHLEDEGHVIVSLPNVAAWPTRLALLGGRFDYRDSGVLDRTHLRFFTRASAAALLEQAGLSVMRRDQTPMLSRAAKDALLPLARALSSDGARFDHDPTALARSLPYKAYHALLRPLEDDVARAAPGLFGFQNVLLARRPPRPRKLSLTVGLLTRSCSSSTPPPIARPRSPARRAPACCASARHGATGRPWSCSCTPPPRTATRSSTSTATSPTRPRICGRCGACSRRRRSTS